MSIEVKDLGIVGIIIGVGTAVWSAYQNYKTKQEVKQTTEKLGMSIEDFSNHTKVDIEQRMIDKAVERAVEREVHKATVEAVAAVKTDIHTTIAKDVKKEVDSQYKTLSEEVTEKISEQVASISEDALSQKVIPRVEEKLMKKGENDIARVVSEVRTKANSGLTNVLSTYDDLSSVLGRFMHNSNGGNNNRTFTIGV